MTLVLSYLDASVTVHVADRRLSVKVGNKYKPMTEDAVKVALVSGTILVSYAGRAQVQGLPTPRWIETRLVQAADGDLMQLFPKLAQRLTDVFNDHRYKDDITIATVSGWALDQKNKLIPVIGTLTNQDPNTFARLPAFRGVAASAAEAAPDGGKAGWVATGRLTKQGHAELTQRLDDELAHGANAADIANIFIDQIRIEADRDGDGTIGKSLRAAILPVAVLNWAQQTGNSEYVMQYSADGHYILGQPMVVDLPDGQRMEAHLFSDLQFGDPTRAESDGQ